MAHVGPILERKRAEARAYLASALEIGVHRARTAGIPHW
jgi:hypothetical protein